MPAIWLPNLLTNTRQENDLSVRLTCVAVKLAQPNAEIGTMLREHYARDAHRWAAFSDVVAVHSQMVVGTA